MRRRRLLHIIGLVLILSVIAMILSYAPLDNSMLTRVEITELKLGVEVTGTLQAIKTSAIGPPQIADVYRFKISMMAPEGDKSPFCNASRPKAILKPSPAHL